jgi:hypothetical protein
MNVQHTASLHEKTVQQDARGELKNMLRRRGSDKGPRMRTERRRVHPLAWAQALKLADGDHRRIEVLSELSVIVHNRPWGTRALG